MRLIVSLVILHGAGDVMPEGPAQREQQLWCQLAWEVEALCFAVYFCAAGLFPAPFGSVSPPTTAAKYSML